MKRPNWSVVFIITTFSAMMLLSFHIGEGVGKKKIIKKIQTPEYTIKKESADEIISFTDRDLQLWQLAYGNNLNANNAEYIIMPRTVGYGSYKYWDTLGGLARELDTVWVTTIDTLFYDQYNYICEWHK